MQTQCPHCNTRFRVTESQITIADGFVRCSVCKEIFNALDLSGQDNLPSSLNQPEDSHDDFDTNIQDASQTSENTAAVNFNETSATDESRKDAFDFFDETDSESMSHVVPEKYKEAPATDSPSMFTNILWGLATLLLSAALFFEYAWFNRDQLTQASQLQTITEKLCRHITCKNITVRHPDKIELVSRNVYSHPNEKNALMVNVTMKNQARFAQPFPVMQIKFSDVRGGGVAGRRFLPNEYLPAEIWQQQKQPLLEPDTHITFTMEIKDPGKQALTYEFDFL